MPPKIPHEEPSEPPQAVIYRVPLVAMGEKEGIVAVGVPEGDTFIYLDSLKEGFIFPTAVVIVPVQGFGDLVRVPSLHIMVSPNHMKPLFRVEFAHQPEHVAVGTPDIGEIPVLPQFIHVPDLDIGEAFVVIVVQGVEEQGLVMGKVIRPTVVPTVYVTEEYELGRVVKLDLVG
jgi:hypothetical protein